MANYERFGRDSYLLKESHRQAARRALFNHPSKRKPTPNEQDWMERAGIAIGREWRGRQSGGGPTVMQLVDLGGQCLGKIDDGEESITI